MDNEQLTEFMRSVTQTISEMEQAIADLQLGPSGTAGSVTGSGANTQVAYWTAVTVLAGDAGMTYDAANDRLHVGEAMIDPGLGLAAPDGTLHVHTASAGAVVADADADDLVVESDTDGGMSILTPANKSGAIYFGSPTGEIRGGFLYEHALDELYFLAEGAIHFSMTEESFNVLPTSYITMADDTWIGLGAAAGRIVFDDQALDEINFLDCRVGIGVTAPLAKLHVDQDDSAGAMPVITLDQADTNIVLMKIIGTAAAASADRTLVAASDFGTPGALVGWVQVEIDDVGNRIADGDYYTPIYAAPT